MSTIVVQQTQGKDATRPQHTKPKLPSGFLRKLTTKLKPPTLHQKPSNSVIPSSPTSPTSHRSAVPIASTDAAAIKRRQDALHRCGLVPLPRKDLSQLEHELDQRYSQLIVLSQDQPEQGELTSAEKIRREWQAKNEALPEKQDHDIHLKVPSDITSVPSDPTLVGNSDFASNAEAQKIPNLTIPASFHTLPTTASPVSLYSIPPVFLFPGIPKENVAKPETEKKLPPVPYSPSVPLPDSPLSSSDNLSDLHPTPSPRENKRPPPIVISLITTNDVKQNTEDVTRGRSLSIHSLTTKSSSPALSPTMTASSFSTLPTPRDDESRERLEAIITRSTGGKSRSSRFGKVSDVGRRDSDDLDVVHETIPESPEPTPTGPATWNPNRESTDSMGSNGFAAFVQKREKRRMSICISPPPNKRNSPSSPKRSTANDLGSMWSVITNDFSLKPFDGGRSKSSTSLSTPASTDENRELTPTPSRAAVEQPQSKITRSRSVISNLLSRKKPPQPASMLVPPSPPPSPTRVPSVRIVQNRETLLQDVKGIEDDESRRLTELAFVDY